MIIKNYKFLPFYGLMITILVVLTSLFISEMIQNPGGFMILIIPSVLLFCTAVMNGVILLRSIKFAKEQRRRKLLRIRINNMTRA